MGDHSAQGNATERDAALDAARRLGLNDAGARLASWSSRAIWHLPASGVALAIARAGAKSERAVHVEAAAVRAALHAGVATPRVLYGPIALPGLRFATAFEWITGRRAGPADWAPIVQEAALLPKSGTIGIPVLDWPDATAEREDMRVLGPALAAAVAERSAVASAAVTRLTTSDDLVLSHGDLQPANALIDPSGRAWLLDFEFARTAPREWDPAKLVVMQRRFGAPTNTHSLLHAWPLLDRTRLAACADAQEVLLVLWLVRMAREGTVGAADEARRRAATLVGHSHLSWRHLE